VSGKALRLGLELLGTKSSIRNNPRLAQDLQDLFNATKDDETLPYREKKHTEAVLRWSRGDLYGAALAWEDVLIEHPTDIHALKMANETYFFLGKQMELRDSVVRVMPFWTSRAIPLKSYLHGMYAFGLEETHFYARAEAEAKKGLERNRNDGWASHALAHVYDMESRTKEGIDFLERTENDWKVCNHLATHCYWHWALHHLDEGNVEATTDLLEREVLPRSLTNKSMLDIVDVTALLFRMDLDNSAGYKKTTSKHWDTVYNLVQPHLRDHILTFNDCHMMFACIGSKNFLEAEDMIKDLEDNFKDIPIAGKDYVLRLLKAILAYGREDYRTCVDLLIPLRYRIVKIGGSDSQRDAFYQLIITAALKSDSKHHRKLVEHLIIERHAQKPDSPLNHRLTFKLRELSA
jgi:tetratricopeptide (TPR) repeat protein